VIKPAPVTQFFLQAGSFRKQADADKVRAQIILLGQAVTVESGTVKEETWYRVMVGPFSNREQLTVAQKQLAGRLQQPAVAATPPVTKRPCRSRDKAFFIPGDARR
jgi:cell division protein FtsN